MKNKKQTNYVKMFNYFSSHLKFFVVFYPWIDLKFSSLFWINTSYITESKEMEGDRLRAEA